MRTRTKAKPSVPAIPTVYNNVQFRSRLEARWAAMFDLLEWQLEYEPLDLKNYIPDFLVNKRLIEVKPATKFADYYEAQGTIDRSGWNGPASAVGAIVGPIYGGTPCFGVERLEYETGNPFWAPWCPFDDCERITALWRRAGNLVQWKAPVKQAPPPRVVDASNTNEPAPVRNDELVPKDEVRSFFRNFNFDE